MSIVTGLHHVSVLVSDTQRALSFYHELLELPLDDKRPELGFPGAWLAVGDQQLHLLELPENILIGALPEHGGRDRHIALTVSNLEHIRTALDTQCVAYSLSRSGRRALFCRDPDGNAIELIEVAGG